MLWKLRGRCHEHRVHHVEGLGSKQMELPPQLVARWVWPPFVCPQEPPECTGCSQRLSRASLGLKGH